MTIFYSKEPIYRQTNDILSANVHLTPTETGKNSIEKALFFVQKKISFCTKNKNSSRQNRQNFACFQKKALLPFPYTGSRHKPAVKGVKGKKRYFF